MEMGGRGEGVVEVQEGCAGEVRAGSAAWHRRWTHGSNLHGLSARCQGERRGGHIQTRARCSCAPGSAGGRAPGTAWAPVGGTGVSIRGTPVGHLKGI